SAIGSPPRFRGHAGCRLATPSRSGERAGSAATRCRSVASRRACRQAGARARDTLRRMSATPPHAPDGHPPAASASHPRFTQVANCDLRRAGRITPWFHEDDICWVAECEICETPMVVWRYHGVDPPPDHREHMRARLTEVATRVFGDFYVDDHMRNIP